MPATRPKDAPPPPPPPAPPPPDPNYHYQPHTTPQGGYGGAWHWTGDQWTWYIHGTPDPASAALYGNDQLTDFTHLPGGGHNPVYDKAPNGGSWVPVHGGGWEWVYGKVPDPNLAKTYGYDKLTDIKKTPHGANNPAYDPDPPPLDVAPPTLGQPWGTDPPHITGDGLPQPSGDAPKVDKPPSHRAYHVSPGSLRNAEIQILTGTQSTEAAYDHVKSTLQSKSAAQWFGQFADEQPLATTAYNENKMHSIQDNLLLAIGNILVGVGDYVKAINNAAQSYAHADLESFVPDA